MSNPQGREVDYRRQSVGTLPLDSLLSLLVIYTQFLVSRSHGPVAAGSGSGTRRLTSLPNNKSRKPSNETKELLENTPQRGKVLIPMVQCVVAMACSRNIANPTDYACFPQFIFKSGRGGAGNITSPTEAQQLPTTATEGAALERVYSYGRGGSNFRYGDAIPMVTLNKIEDEERVQAKSRPPSVAL